MRAVLATVLGVGLVFGQDPANVFEKAPPDVDSALRARVTEFYGDFVAGKFRQADALVAEDSKDMFFVAEKRRYDACVVGNITYSENYTQAKAVTTCDTEYFFAGRRVPVKLPIVSNWKIVDGQWFWSIPPRSAEKVDSPFGPVTAPSEDGAGSKPPISIPDPNLILAQVRNGVRADVDEVNFNGKDGGSQEVHIKNSLPGRASITADSTGIAGLTVKPAKLELVGGEEATVVFSYHPKDPKATQPRLAGSVLLRVDPTGQELAVRVNIEMPRN